MSKLLDNLEEIEMQKASFIIPKNLKKDVKALGVTGILDDGIDTSDATATSKDIKEGKTAYVNDKKITGTLQQADTDWALNGITDEPISVELKTGNPDYIQMKFKRSGTDIVVGGSSNVTANMSQETMAVVSNITPDKIKSGEVILGIAGNYIGLDTSDATATADDILKNATAYVNGTKVVGNVADYRDGTITPSDADIEWVGDPQVDRISFTEKYGGYNVCFIGPNTTLGAYTPVSKLANFINLTPDILKKDENRLGITGTYEGSGISNFANNLDELQQLVNTYSDYYITMNNITNLSNAFCNYQDLKIAPNFNTTGVTNMANIFRDCTNLISVPSFDTTSVTNMFCLYYNCSNLIMTPNLNTSNVSSMCYMFCMCSNLVSIPNYDTSNVTNTIQLFAGCYNLIAVPNLDMSNVLDMSGTFYGCYNLTNIPNFNTSSAVKMFTMFASCPNLITVPNFNTSKVTDMSYMFDGCYNLTNVPNFNVSKVIDMDDMFSNCYNLVSVPNFNTTNVVAMAAMFYGCHNLTNIPNFNTSNVTNMYLLFSDCYNLSSIPNLDTSNVTNMHYMFYNCSNLTDIPNLNTSKVTDMGEMFYNCRYLNNIPQFNTNKVNFMQDMFAYCERLSNESYANIANMLPLAQNLTNQYVSDMGLDINKFTNIQKNILINKGYKDFGSSNSYSEYYDIYYT